MNGTKFDELEFSSEEAFEKLVKENFKTLFGAKTVYFDIKSKIDSKTFGSAIPDGFLFDFKDEENPEFYLVEVELQKHDFHNHIFPQVTKFFAFFKNPKSRYNLIDKLFSFVKSNPKLEQDFRQYLGKKELYKALKDVIENSQNILIVLDDEKPEMQEVFDTYTETWDKMVKVEILKQYSANDQTIFTINPDFEEIDIVDRATEQESDSAGDKYTENYHLENTEQEIVSAYYSVKNGVLSFDSSIKINPRKPYISLSKNKIFAYIQIKREKMHIIVMLPYEIGIKLIKKNKIAELSPRAQKSWNGHSFRATLENSQNVDEILNVLKEAYKNSLK